jgi:hypothetical protein
MIGTTDCVRVSNPHALHHGETGRVEELLDGHWSQPNFRVRLDNPEHGCRWYHERDLTMIGTDECDCGDQD